MIDQIKVTSSFTPLSVHTCSLMIAHTHSLVSLSPCLFVSQVNDTLNDAVVSGDVQSWSGIWSKCIPKDQDWLIKMWSSLCVALLYSSPLQHSAEEESKNYSVWMWIIIWACQWLRWIQAVCGSDTEVGKMWVIVIPENLVEWDVFTLQDPHCVRQSKTQPLFQPVRYIFNRICKKHWISIGR